MFLHVYLLLDELKTVAENRGIKDYKNKSEKDLRKILNEPKPKIGVSIKKIKDFSELKPNFSKEEISSEKVFISKKNYIILFAAEIREVGKILLH